MVRVLWYHTWISRLLKSTSEKKYYCWNFARGCVEHVYLGFCFVLLYTVEFGLTAFIRNFAWIFIKNIGLLYSFVPVYSCGFGTECRLTQWVYDNQISVQQFYMSISYRSVGVLSSHHSILDNTIRRIHQCLLAPVVCCGSHISLLLHFQCGQLWCLLFMYSFFLINLCKCMSICKNFSKGFWTCLFPLVIMYSSMFDLSQQRYIIYFPLLP